jgi:hypothetical protein
MNQGCPGEGLDTRAWGWLICPLQQLLSWRTAKAPKTFKRFWPAIAVCWPPYVVVNLKRSDGRWRMFRAGFRFDRTWKGYIFPSAAFKIVDQPLLY